MALPHAVEERLRNRKMNPTGPTPKRGHKIFEGTDYPRDWAGFIGQEQAKEQLQAAVASAIHRVTRLDHTLLASGLHGIGKTTLAYIIANKAGVGITSVSGPLSVDEARTVLMCMQDRDILFWDEFHLAVAGNKSRADWLLPFLTDSELMTANGAEKMPNVTVVGATTDGGKLPQTILSRFMVRPKLLAYTEEQAVKIVRNLSDRMGIAIDPDEELPIAKAANHNPRDMRMILTAVRDVAYTGNYNLDKALQWAGVTYDGIDTVGQDILLVLLASTNHTASMESLQAQLGEPGPLKHHEQRLMQKGFLTVTGRGRVLTDEGVERATALLEERHDLTSA